MKERIEVRNRGLLSSLEVTELRDRIPLVLKALDLRMREELELRYVGAPGRLTATDWLRLLGAVDSIAGVLHGRRSSGSEGSASPSLGGGRI